MGAGVAAGATQARGEALRLLLRLHQHHRHGRVLLAPGVARLLLLLGKKGGLRLGIQELLVCLLLKRRTHQLSVVAALPALLLQMDTFFLARQRRILRRALSDGRVLALAYLLATRLLVSWLLINAIRLVEASRILDGEVLAWLSSGLVGQRLLIAL